MSNVCSGNLSVFLPFSNCLPKDHMGIQAIHNLSVNKSNSPSYAQCKIPSISSQPIS